ncbi:MAG: hypothetical protein U0996_05270 [Planctomycetaceae bacterium]
MGNRLSGPFLEVTMMWFLYTAMLIVLCAVALIALIGLLWFAARKLQSDFQLLWLEKRHFVLKIAAEEPLWSRRCGVTWLVIGVIRLLAWIGIQVADTWGAIPGPRGELQDAQVLLDLVAGMFWLCTGSLVLAGSARALIIGASGTGILAFLMLGISVITSRFGPGSFIIMLLQNAMPMGAGVCALSWWRSRLAAGVANKLATEMPPLSISIVASSAAEAAALAPTVAEPSVPRKIRIQHGCGQRMQIDPRLIGRQVRCRKCGERFVVSDV